MALGVFAEKGVVDCFYKTFKEAGAVGREVENYRQGEHHEGEFYAVKGERDGYYREDNRGKSAHGTAANFSFGDFWILNMWRI